MSEQKKIDNVLAAIDRPEYVAEIRHVLGTDHTGDPIVRIWVILEDDIAARARILEYTEPVRSTIVQALRDAEVDHWPHLRFRSQSEQAELDREEAA